MRISDVRLTRSESISLMLTSILSRVNPRPSHSEKVNGILTICIAKHQTRYKAGLAV